MHEVLNLNEYRSILCLNGALPNKVSFFLNSNLPIIAADGAANSLLDLGILPTLIIGDLDSVKPPLLEKHPFIHVFDQGSSDYQKAIHYLKENNLLPSIILGINGGALDHILNNINIFMETNCLLYSPPVKGFVIKEKSQTRLILPTQTKISLIGIPKATLSSKGLQWELNETHLCFPGKTSCFNRTRLSEIVLEVNQGSVLVLIYEQPIEDAGLHAFIN